MRKIPGAEHVATRLAEEKKEKQQKGKEGGKKAAAAVEMKGHAQA